MLYVRYRNTGRYKNMSRMWSKDNCGWNTGKAETRRMHDRNCPYCNREMDRGYINCRGERGAAKVCWCTGDPGFLSDIMGELGVITAARAQNAVGSAIEIPAYYCNACKKIIIETDLTQKL